MSAMIPTHQIGIVVAALRLLSRKIGAGEPLDDTLVNVICGDGGAMPLPGEIDDLAERLDREG